MQNFLYKFLMPFFMVVLTIFTIVVPIFDVKASTYESVVLVSDTFYYAVDDSNTIKSITSTNANVGMAFATTDNLFDLYTASTDKYYYFGRNNNTLGRQLAYFLEMDNVINSDYTSTAGLTYEFIYYLDTSVYNPFDENKLLLPLIFKADVSNLAKLVRNNEDIILNAENVDQNLIETDYGYSLSSSPTCELYEDSTSVYKCSAQFYISPEFYNSGTGNYYFGFMHKDSSSYLLPKIIFKDFLLLDRTVNEYKMTITPDPTPTPEVTPTPTPSVNDELNNIQNSITDESGPSLGSLSDSAGWLPAGPVDSIINLPLTFFQSVNNALSDTCVPVTLPLPFVEKAVELPCVMSLYEKIDGLMPWVESISIVASAFILYKYLLHLYKWVDDTLTFRENTWADWGGV